MSAPVLDMPLASMRHCVAPIVDRHTPARNQHAAWQREMERAETEEWFRQPAVLQLLSAAAAADNVEPVCLTAHAAGDRRAHVAADETSTNNMSSASSRDSFPAPARHGSRRSGDTAQILSTGRAIAGPGADDKVGAVSKATTAATCPSAVVVRRTSIPAISAAPIGVIDAASSPCSSVERAPGDTTTARSPVVATQPATAKLQGAVTATTEASTAEPLPSSPPNVFSASPLSAWPTATRDGVPELNQGAPLRRAMFAAMDRVAPLRVHVEWNGDIAAVWVGIDRAAETALPHLIASMATALVGQGLRLRSVVCNGTRRYQATAMHGDDNPSSKPADIFIGSES